MVKRKADLRPKLRPIQLRECDSAIILRRNGSIEAITPVPSEEQTEESSHALLAAAVVAWIMSEPELYDSLVESFMSRNDECPHECENCSKRSDESGADPEHGVN